MLGTITYLDRYNKSAKMRFTNCPDHASVVTLAAALLPFTHAIQKVATVSELCPEANDDPTTEDGFDSVEMKAQLDFENQSETELGKRHFMMNLPAPQSSVFSGEDDKGLRVNEGVGDVFATNITAFTGNQTRFKRGHCKVKKSRKAI